MEKVTNFLVPKHRKLSEEEISKLLEEYSVQDSSKFPKIKVKDPALDGLDAQIGDVIEITRKSFVGENQYYRVVVE